MPSPPVSLWVLVPRGAIITHAKSWAGDRRAARHSGPAGSFGHGSEALALAGLRRVMLRAHRQAWCWQDEWTELSMADIRALEEETARMLAQRMAKCTAGGDGPEVEPQGKPSTEPRAGASRASTPDRPEAPRRSPDASPDASFGKQWSSSSRSSYSSQHGGAGRLQAVGGVGAVCRLSTPPPWTPQVACLPRSCLSGACRTSRVILRTARMRNSLMPTVSAVSQAEGREVSGQCSPAPCPP